MSQHEDDDWMGCAPDPKWKPTHRYAEEDFLDGSMYHKTTGRLPAPRANPNEPSLHTNMNIPLHTAVALAQQGYTTVKVRFFGSQDGMPTAKCYTYKCLEADAAKLRPAIEEAKLNSHARPLAVVMVHKSGGVVCPTCVEVVQVDDEPDISLATDAPQLKWIVSPVDTTAYNATLSAEIKLTESLTKTQRKVATQAARQAVLQTLPEELKKELGVVS